MMILADASLPLTKASLSPLFNITTFSNMSELKNLISKCEILLCRSTLKVDAALLAKTPVQCVATASSGNDHIDKNYLNAHNIKLIDAKGSNATAVADYMLACIAYLQSNQSRTLQKAGIIGIGEVGTRMVKRLNTLGFKTYCYDPIKAVQYPENRYCTFEDLFSCDILCIHANYHEAPPYPSANLFNQNVLQRLAPNTVIINAARGGIVDENALLSINNNLIYCTDVYQKEPHIQAAIVDKATICTPHIAGHSIEAKTNAITMIYEKLHNIYIQEAYTPQSNIENHDLFLEYLRKNASDLANWQEMILNYYQPMLETKMLKQAKNKTEAFLQLRHAHQYRHEFSHILKKMAIYTHLPE